MKQISPSYISIKVNGNNLQSQKMKKVATRYRINQELKFFTQKYSTSSDTVHIWNALPPGPAPGKS
jgi:hypothetical protein